MYYTYYTYYTYFHYTYYGQVRQDLGIANHVWQDKRAKGLLLPKQLMTWVISFVLPCSPAGLPTFELSFRTMPSLLPALQWGRVVVPD